MKKFKGKSGLAEFALDGLPAVRLNSRRYTLGPLLVQPVLETFYMDVLHRAGT